MVNYLPKRSKTKTKKKTKEKWIQKAKLKKGALRNYVKSRYGKKGFTEKGTIKVSVLRELASDPDVQEKTRRRARLALKLREF